MITGDANNARPFLDWSLERLCVCDSCRLHLAPVCSRCNVSTCFGCSKYLQRPRMDHRMQADNLRSNLPYLVKCPCGHRYKRDRDRSPFTTPETDDLWDKCGGHNSNDIHPQIGCLSSPCGRMAPSNKHNDRVPRTVRVGKWEAQPIEILCRDPTKARQPRRRSRSPPRRDRPARSPQRRDRAAERSFERRMSSMQLEPSSKLGGTSRNTK